MYLRSILLAACVISSAAFAQEEDGNRVPFDIQRESGIYTTKELPVVQPQQPLPYAVPSPQLQRIQPPPQKMRFPDKVPFGRASPDALVPAPTGPRTTTSAPIPGVDMMEASEPMPGDILANELPEAIQNPTKATAQTGSIFEDKDAVPHPVELRALNKVTGNATLITLQPGTQEVFGNLTIIARVCRSALEDTQPDSAALLEILETKPGETVTSALFSGWMFASSPSLTGLEHPVYDVSVVGCKKAKNTAESSQKTTPSS